MVPPSDQVSTPLRLYLLGAFRLERGTRTLRLSTHKADSLFAYLALHPEKHPREKLAALFWGDATDEQARHSLRSALSALRKALGDEAIRTDRETAQLNPEFALWVDDREFQQIADGRWLIADGAQAPAISHLQSAISLYRGDL